MLQALPIGHVFRSEEELERHAWDLTGRSAGEVADLLGMKIAKSDQGGERAGLGELVERYFGKLRDNAPEPDIKNLGIEIKTLPMERRSAAWRVKEPTSVTQIDYHELARQNWATAPIRKKIKRILWVPFEHDKTDKRRCVFRRPFLWSPPAVDEPAFQADFDGVRQMVRQGKAHELSETLSKVLAARRKGASGSRTTQPYSAEPAKTRAWAFKTAYTQPLLEQNVLREAYVSIASPLGVTDLREVIPEVESRLRRFEGWTLSRLAKETGATIRGGKAGPADFVRKALGIPARGRIEELEKLGIRIHTVPVRASDMMPFEATPFPRMDPDEFLEEDWEESQLSEDVDAILFIPLLSERKGLGTDRVIGRAFVWRPTTEQWRTLEAEWRMFQEIVRREGIRYVPRLDAKGRPRYRVDGRPLRDSNLPSAEETECIHIRPHADDSEDEDTTRLGTRATGQSFWLNKKFVQRLLLDRRSRQA